MLGVANPHFIHILDCECVICSTGSHPAHAAPIGRIDELFACCSIDVGVRLARHHHRQKTHTLRLVIIDVSSLAIQRSYELLERSQRPLARSGGGQAERRRRAALTCRLSEKRLLRAVLEELHASLTELRKPQGAPSSRTQA